MQSAGSLEKDFVLVEHEFEYTAKDGRIITIRPNERYILLKKTNEHWWHVCVDNKSKPFYIPAKYVKVLPSTSLGTNNFQVFRDQSEELIEHVPSSQYSYAFLPPDQSVSTSISLSTADIQQISSSNIVPSNNGQMVNTGNSLPSVNVPHISTRNSVLSASAPQISTSNTLPSATVPQIGTNNTFPLSSVPRISTSNTLPSASVPRISASNITSSSSMPQISSTQSGSLQDIPVAHESSSIDTVQIFSQDHTDAGRSFTPMRTFNNSKKIVDPSKRISYLCSYDPQPNIRSTQSLENINTEPSIDQNQQTQRTNDSCRGLHHVKPVTTEQSNKAGSKESLSPSQAVKEEAAEEKEEIVSPIYVNINDIRKEGARERLSSRQHSSTSTLEDWETHTDKDSGQLFYYNSVTGATTWDSPFDQPEDQVHSPLSQASLSPLPGDNEWEKHFDEASGLFFFYNSVTGETSWEPPIEEGMNFQGMKPGFSLYSSTDRRPPTPEADYPDYSPEELENYPDADYDLDHPAMYDSLPPDKPYGDQTTGWYCQINKDGKKCFTNSFNNETWLQSEDQYGKTYFYTPDGAFSQWSLPQVGPPSIQSRYSEPDQDNEIFTNWNNNFTAFALQKDVREISPLHRRSDSENSFLNYSGHQHQTKSLEKAGVLHKTKIAENGKRLRKNWSSSWTVLEGGILTFFKDGKNLSSNSLKSQSVLTTPEHTVRLQGAKLGWAAKDKSSKKNVLDLKTLDGCEYLIHHDSETITADWYTSIQNSIGRNIRTSTEQPLEDEVDSAQEFGSNEKLVLKDEKEKEKKSQGHSSNSSNSDSDRNVRAKLKKFLQRRPTLQSLKDKGYIKEQVFGCPLNQLCEREKQNVPAFVKKAIQAVEKRGLDIDGLYRVSGNLAIIQKLRYKVDHDENFNLDDGRWEDVHVITGALKLFFRELPEPLFPYSHFDKFIEAIKISDQTQKRKVLKDLVQSLPPPNLETMRLLFRHLCSVIEYREANRMSVQSVAIVFGPTLLRPETEGTNIAMFMVFQNQIVEQILNNYKYIFNVS